MQQPYRSPFAPLPGTTRAPRGVFLDRWGSLLALPLAGEACSSADVQFLPGALQALFRLSKAGWRIYFVGNEPAVAEGRVDDATWAAIEAAIADRLRAAGIVVARTYVCLDHPQGKGGHRNESVYLLPNTGAFYHASHNDGIELRRSWVIGDSTLELVAGWRAGCRLAGVRSGQGLTDGTYHVDPDFVGADLAEVLDVLRRSEDALAA
jgi:histidinol phosphatase-like enzyme